MVEEPRYKTAFQNNPTFAPYDSDSLLIFALSIHFNIDDLSSLTSDVLLEGADDKKIDALFIDEDELETAVIIQSYLSQDETKQSASANKASDLNTAVAWALNQPIETLPERIRTNIIYLRNVIKDHKIKHLEFWYVHNLPESPNVNAELMAVERSAKVALDQNFPDNNIEVRAIEVGNNTLEQWYLSLKTPININDTLEVSVNGGYSITGNGWNSYMTYIRADLLKRWFQEYGNNLFSANIRGYLGSRKSDSNINNGIKDTCEKEPENLWVYNNGITCLVNRFEISDEAKGGKKITLKGLAIVNGAQTTGAVGSVLSNIELDNAFIPTRFVSCENKEIIEKIIRYNNSQNQVNASDFRSNDKIQRRLRDEFNNIPSVVYKGRRGGAEDAIQRTPNLIPSDTVAQALAAFHGDSILAYNKKSEIWENDKHYSNYFNESTTARHIIFVYSLLKAIESKKRALIEKSNNFTITDTESEELEVLRNRGSILLFVQAIGNCQEAILNKKVVNSFRISFGNPVSPNTAITYWSPIVDVTIPFSKQLTSALAGGLKNNDKVKEAISNFKSLVESTKTVNKSIFDEFASHVLDD